MVKIKNVILIIAIAVALSGCKTTSPTILPSVLEMKPSRPALKPVPENALIPVEMVENFIIVSSYAKELEAYCGLLEEQI